MNRKVIIGIVAVLIIAVVAVLGYSFLSNDSDDNNVNNENNNSNNVTNNEDSTQDDNIGSVLGKTLIVYYSATGNTKEVAEEMAEDLNADINRIQHLEVGEKLNLFQELYDNDYRQNGSDYMTAYKSNLMADAKIRFQLATGHDVTSEYGDNLIQNLKLNRIRR